MSVQKVDKKPTPYRRLRDEVIVWMLHWRYPRKVFCEEINASYHSLSGLRRAIQTAQDLEWDTRVSVKNDKLVFEHIERPPDPPEKVRP